MNAPIIHHIFELLARHGVNEAYVNAHYLADALLRAYGGESYIDGMRVRLEREKELIDTAGGVKHLAGIASTGALGETFVAESDDALTDIDMDDLIAFHNQKEALATLALKGVYDTSDFRVVELDEEDNILSFQEKPNAQEAISTLINTGVYVLELRALGYLPQNTFYDFAVGHKCPGGLSAGQVQRALGEGTREETGREFVDRGERRVHSSATFEGCVVVGRDAVIERDVVLSVDATVGKGCWIRRGATIQWSILLPGASEGDGAYLEDCIVGHGYSPPGLGSPSVRNVEGNVFRCLETLGGEDL